MDDPSQRNLSFTATRILILFNVTTASISNSYINSSTFVKFMNLQHEQENITIIKSFNLKNVPLPSMFRQVQTKIRNFGYML